MSQNESRSNINQEVEEKNGDIDCNFDFNYCIIDSEYTYNLPPGETSEEEIDIEVVKDYRKYSKREETFLNRIAKRQSKTQVVCESTKQESDDSNQSTVEEIVTTMETQTSTNMKAETETETETKVETSSNTKTEIETKNATEEDSNQNENIGDDLYQERKTCINKKSPAKKSKNPMKKIKKNVNNIRNQGTKNKNCQSLVLVPKLSSCTFKNGCLKQILMTPSKYHQYANHMETSRLQCRSKNEEYINYPKTLSNGASLLIDQSANYIPFTSFTYCTLFNILKKSQISHYISSKILVFDFGNGTRIIFDYSWIKNYYDLPKFFTFQVADRLLHKAEMLLFQETMSSSTQKLITAHENTDALVKDSTNLTFRIEDEFFSKDCSSLSHTPQPHKYLHDDLGTNTKNGANMKISTRACINSNSPVSHDPEPSLHSATFEKREDVIFKKPSVEPYSNPEMDRELDPESDLDSESDSKSDVESNKESELGVEPKSKSKSDADSDSDREPDSDLVRHSESDSKSDSDSDKESESRSKSKSKSDADSCSAREPDSDLDRHSESDSKSDLDKGSESESEIDTGTEKYSRLKKSNSIETKVSQNVSDNLDEFNSEERPNNDSSISSDDSSIPNHPINESKHYVNSGGTWVLNNRYQENTNYENLHDEPNFQPNIENQDEINVSSGNSPNILSNNSNDSFDDINDSSQPKKNTQDSEIPDKRNFHEPDPIDIESQESKKIYNDINFLFGTSLY
ncbi:hypothetical protein M0813_16588 [Anaeramoeba flamelloides]|uniref:Uncharacterized protein n=1 Tax=Anaeramoeba flamelloides TaxID=1746091 RepID=A0ABQ8YZ25_9EUKA|nr:hypothetical protein M0813_16588 [Anaeramoeba flamelloides]